jgi:hypothetical protein
MAYWLLMSIFKIETFGKFLGKTTSHVLVDFVQAALAKFSKTNVSRFFLFIVCTGGASTSSGKKLY